MKGIKQDHELDIKETDWKDIENENKELDQKSMI